MVWEVYKRTQEHREVEVDAEAAQGLPLSVANGVEVLHLKKRTQRELREACDGECGKGGLKEAAKEEVEEAKEEVQAGKVGDGPQTHPGDADLGIGRQATFSGISCIIMCNNVM